MRAVNRGPGFRENPGGFQKTLSTYGKSIWGTAGGKTAPDSRLGAGKFSTLKR